MRFHIHFKISEQTNAIVQSSMPTRITTVPGKLLWYINIYRTIERNADVLLNACKDTGLAVNKMKKQLLRVTDSFALQLFNINHHRKRLAKWPTMASGVRIYVETNSMAYGTQRFNDSQGLSNNPSPWAKSIQFIPLTLVFKNHSNVLLPSMPSRS